jgi:hypothetical protein
LSRRKHGHHHSHSYGHDGASFSVIPYKQIHRLTL